MISKNTVLPPGGWYSLIWAIWGRADEQGIFQSTGYRVTEYFSPKQGQEFKSLAAPLYLNMG